MGIRVRFFTLLSLLLTVAVCAGLGAFSAGCGAASTGSATSDVGTADPLTAVETSLYDSGTYDFPVTIAKLDSPALESVTVTVEAISVSTESISANLVRYADSDPGYLYTITVAAGGIDYATTPKFIVYNNTLGTSGIFDANADGSVVATSLGNLGDAILFTSMNATEDQVGPFLSVKTDADGNLGAVTLTNTDDLLADQELMTDGLGNYYLSVVNDDDTTYTFMRRNLDGSEVEIIAADLASQVRVVTAVNGDQIMVILQNGSVLHFVVDSSASVSALVAESTTSLQVETATWTSTEIDSITGGLVDFSTMANSGHKLFLNSGESILYHLQPNVDADGNPFTEYLIIHDLVDGASEEVLMDSAGFGQRIFMDLGEADTLYVVALWPGEAVPTLSRFSLVTSFNPIEQKTLMDAREVLIADFSGLQVESMDVSDTGVVAIMAVEPITLVSRILFWTEEFGMKEITDPLTSTAGQFTTAKVAPDGSSIVFCEVVASGDNFFGAVRVHVPLLHEEHEFANVIESTEFTYCTDGPGSIFIDGNGFIYLYEMLPPPAEGLPQLLVVDPRMHSAF